MIDPCCFADDPQGTECGAWLQRHHVVRQQTIKREVPLQLRERVLADPRLQVTICDAHHTRVTAKSLRITEAQAPEAREASREYGLEAKLDRELVGADHWKTRAAEKVPMTPDPTDAMEGDGALELRGVAQPLPARLARPARKADARVR